ncbi:carbon storage regulator [Acidiferrobacter sp.]
MLIITRKRGERIVIDLDPAADPETRAADLFAQGPLEILLVETARGSARLAIAAARSLTVRRAPSRDPSDTP